MILRGLRWVRRELHSRRDPVGFARSLGVQVGDDCRLLSTSVQTWGSEPYLVRLGNRVLITAQVRFITHDGAVWPFRREHPTIDRMAPIVVSDDCFIGLAAIILPGVTLGESSVVGAGSVVNKDVPARTIVAGTPARPICSIDDYFQRHQAAFIYGVNELKEPARRERLLAHVGWSRRDGD